MAGIISAGIGSGLDITSLVSGLVASTGQPQLTLLATQEAKLTTQLTAVGSLSGALSGLQTSLSNLSSLTSFQTRTASSSNPAVYTATATAGATAGTHRVEVNNLAAAQQLASQDFTNSTTTVGTGTLTFQLGTYDATGNTFTSNPKAATAKSVTIDASNNSLQGIVGAVNSANIGVTASIVNDGTGSRLVFSSQNTGAANSLKVTVSGDADSNNTDNLGLSQLAYDPTATAGAGKNLSQTTAAADASVLVDGIAVTSSTNTVSGAIPNVTLNLLSSPANTPTTLSVATDTSAVTNNLQGFVTAYNSLYTTMKGLSSYDAATKTAGPLLGDSTMLSIKNQVQTTIGNMVAGIGGGSFNSLAAIGITTQKDGSLALDSTALASALNQDPSSVGRIFAVGGTASDAQVSYNASTSATVAGDYALHISQVATQGVYAGAVPTAPTLQIDGTNNTFGITVNGVTSSTITIPQKTYTSNDELATAMQTSINSDATLKAANLNVSVKYDTDHFVFASSAYGSVSKVNISSASAGVTDALGLAYNSGTSTAGLDVAGTIGGHTATGFGQLLTGASGGVTGLQVQVQGGVSGDRGTVSFSRGVADQLNTLITGFLDTKTGSLTDRTNELNTNISNIDTRRATVNANLVTLQQQYLKQFNAMDTLVSSLKNTGAFLTKQFSSSSSG